MNGRYIESRYKTVLKNLLTNENLEAIRSGRETLQSIFSKKTKKTQETPGVGKSGRIERIEKMNERYELRKPSTEAGPPPSQGVRLTGRQPSQNSVPKVMNNADVKKAFAALVASKSLGNASNIVSKKIGLTGDIQAALAAINRLSRLATKKNILKNVYGLRYNSQSRVEDLLALRTRSNWSSLHPNVQKNVNSVLREKLYRRVIS